MGYLIIRTTPEMEMPVIIWKDNFKPLYRSLANFMVHAYNFVLLMENGELFEVWGNSALASYKNSTYIKP